MKTGILTQTMHEMVERGEQRGCGWAVGGVRRKVERERLGCCSSMCRHRKEGIDDERPRPMNKGTRDAQRCDGDAICECFFPDFLIAKRKTGVRACAGCVYQTKSVRPFDIRHQKDEEKPGEKVRCVWLGTRSSHRRYNYLKGKDRKSTRLNSSHSGESRMPSSA